MNLVIRELSAPDLKDDFLESLGSLAEVGLTVADALAVFRNRLRMGVRTFVAVGDDRVVGTLTLLLEQKFIHGGGWTGHIEDVAVHRDFQGKGIGSALVRHAIEESQRAGCYKVILNCNDQNIAFYSKLGFRKYDAGMRIDLK